MRGALGVGILVLLVSGMTALAGIIGVTGDFKVYPSSTASYVADPYNDPVQAPIRIWSEQTGVALSSAVVLDTDLADPTKRYRIGTPASGYVVFSAGGGPTIPAGTPVNVYYAYFDPVNTGDSARGTVTFDYPVLGIVAYTSELQYSDWLRVMSAPYPGNPAFGARGWEADGEWGKLSADRLTLEVYAGASTPGDQFRIFTGIPEPSTCALIVAGLIGLWGFRRRRP